MYGKGQMCDIVTKFPDGRSAACQNLATGAILLGGEHIAVCPSCKARLEAWRREMYMSLETQGSY